MPLFGPSILGHESMKIERRGFFGVVASALVGACIATKIPTGIIPPPIRKHAAIDYLAREYNRFTKGKLGNAPAAALVGRKLFEAFDDEISAIAFNGDGDLIDSLKFKSATLLHYEGAGLNPWDVWFLRDDQWKIVKSLIMVGKPLEWAMNSA